MNLEYIFIYPILGKLAEKLIDLITQLIFNLYTFIKDFYNNDIFIGYNSFSVHQKSFTDVEFVLTPIGENNIDLIEALKLWITELSKKTNQKKVNLFLSRYNEIRAVQDGNNKRTLCVMPSNTIYYDGLYFKYKVKKHISSEKGANNFIEEDVIIYSKKPLEYIKEYVDNIYHQFLSKYRNFTIQNEKYFLDLQRKNKKNDDIIFKSYQFKVSKTFDDLFFEKKDVILKLLNDFQNQKINKLTLLLSGPPGTGKTSIIKAIINATNRCVISVKLNNIQNESQLSHLIHCDSFTCETSSFGIRSTFRIPKNKRIYIFEDVDADSDILFDRSLKKDDSNDNNILKNLIDLKSNNDINDKSSCDFNTNDDFTLSDILNIFDGIREINESIIIFTTNHPEKLDPAFKRPGRMTFHLEMKKTTNIIAKKFIENYYKEIPTWNIKDNSLTIAQLESFCRISNDLDDLYKILEKENSLDI